MTTRERREARAEKLREWADKREARSEAEYAKARQIGDMIPFGQPILVGHHSEGRHRRDIARIDTAMSRSVESARMAQSMASRADNIEAATDGSIFDDDPDALDRLAERVALLEAERDRIKAYNASCRKGSSDESLLDDRQRAELASARDLEARGHHVLAKGGAFPTYKLSNLSANIKRNRDRIPVIQRRQARDQAAAESENGVVVKRSENIDWCTVTFAEKPARTIINALKEAGFRWGQGAWHGPTSKLPTEGLL